MPDKFSIDIDLYEKLTAVRKTIGLSTSDYLDKAKKSMKEGTEFIVKGKIVNIKRGYCLN
jgi:thiamine monophosphate synthase